MIERIFKVLNFKFFAFLDYRDNIKSDFHI